MFFVRVTARIGVFSVRRALPISLFQWSVKPDYDQGEEHVTAGLPETVSSVGFLLTQFFSSTPA
jgi:hypothetical protein